MFSLFYDNVYLTIESYIFIPSAESPLATRRSIIPIALAFESIDPHVTKHFPLPPQVVLQANNCKMLKSFSLLRIQIFRILISVMFNSTDLHISGNLYKFAHDRSIQKTRHVSQRLWKHLGQA